MKSFTAFAAFTLVASAAAAEYRISADMDFEKDCLDIVQPGDTCYLESGNHYHDGLTKTHGTRDARITITGDPDACIKGSNTQDRALQIAHDYYTIKDICFNGQHGDEYVATAVYVLGADWADTKGDSHGVKSSVTGLQMYNLDIRNWDEECIHLRYFVTFTEISGCVIEGCGKHSFSGGSGVVGEGVYVGTALDQVKDGKTPEYKLRTGSADKPDADVCQFNWIHKNTIRTEGNECVDVKEGSQYNLVEDNICEKQRDENSGCIGFRGSYNTARNNDVTDCTGAGFRCGGDKEYGVGNNIYENRISDADYGAFNIMSEPQGLVCGNDITKTAVVTQGAEKLSFDTDIVTGPCDVDDWPGDIKDEFDTSYGGNGSSGEAEEEEEADAGGGTAVPLDHVGDDDRCAGVNCYKDGDNTGDEDNIVEIQVNEMAGQPGLAGDCGLVMNVINMYVEHIDDADGAEEVVPANLFDGDLGTYYSVRRESTFHILELEEQAEVEGISIGFYMKNEEEKRIQTFDVAVRGYDETEFTTVISRKESSGEYGGIQHFDFSSPVNARYIKIESHGNSFNNWTPFTEFQVCGAAAENNALFDGLARTAKQEIAELSVRTYSCDCDCPSCVLLTPGTVTGTNPTDGEHRNIMHAFDGDFQTRWVTETTQAKNDLDNGKIDMTFQANTHVCRVEVAWFDGYLANPLFSLYRTTAGADRWSNILDNEKAAATDVVQKFDVDETGVEVLSLVGKGNVKTHASGTDIVGTRSKFSEVRVYGC